MPRIELTRHLHRFFPDLEDQTVQVRATTVAEAVDALEELAPGIKFYICDERGRLRPHVNIFIEEERVRDRVHLLDPVQSDSTIFILQALSGG